MRNLRRRARALALLIMFIPLLAPSAQASLVPEYGFEMDIEPMAVKSSEDKNKSLSVNYTFLIGETSVTGNHTGVYGFAGVDTGSLAGAHRIEVYTGRSLFPERVFTGDVDFILNTNASLLIYSETSTIKHTVDAPVGVATIIKPEKALRVGQVLVNAGTCILVGGQSLVAKGEFQQNSTFFATMPDRNSSATIQGREGAASYTGTQFVFRIVGKPVYDISTAGLMVPFTAGANATFRPSSAGDLREEFDPEDLNNAVSGLGMRPFIPPQFAKGLRDFGPILNGVFFGSADLPVVNEEAANATDLAIIRFPNLAVTPIKTGAQIRGESEFILLGKGGFYTIEEGQKIGPFNVPPLSFVMWIVALAAIVAGFLLRPIIAGPQLGGFGTIRLLAIIFHGLALVVAIVLWDQEIKSFLGTSLITLFATGQAAQPTIMGVTALFQLATFGIATLLFGMPVRFVVNSGLKLGGLKKARGVGKGVGNLAVWGIGAPFIPFILNGFVGAIVDSLQKALAGG